MVTQSLLVFPLPAHDPLELSFQRLPILATNDGTAHDTSSFIISRLASATRGRRQRDLLWEGIVSAAAHGACDDAVRAWGRELVLGRHGARHVPRAYAHVTRRQMRDAIARVPVSPQMLDSVKLAVDVYGAAVVIMSDSNEFYISSMLEHHGLQDKYITEVHANKAQWEDDESTRLRVRPYHPEEEEPHGCALCPSNLCKGRILDELRKKTEYDIVLYVGNGRGDYCPVTRLTSHDTVFARANDASGRSFGLLQMTKDASHSVQARVVEWQTGGDIFEHFQKTLEAGHRVDTL